MRIPFLIVGSLLEGVAVLGFVLASPVLAVLATTPALSSVHLLSGIAATTAALRGIKAMRQTGRVLGFGYLALAILGAAVDTAWVHAILPPASATAWFHAVIAAVMLYYALLAPPKL